MSKKMTGAEYKAFIAADWDALLGLTNAYMDAQEVTVDGVDEPEDPELIPDNAKVVIHTGCVQADEDCDLSLVAAYGRWKKVQTHTFLTVEVPNDAVDKLKGIVKELNGKVL